MGKWAQSAQLWRAFWATKFWARYMVKEAKKCVIVQGIWWNLNFRAISRGFLSRWKKPRKNRQKWPKRSGRSGVPDFNGNFEAFNFEIERWSERSKWRKLTKEFDGIGIFWKFWEVFWENQKNWKIPFLTKLLISQKPLVVLHGKNFHRLELS